jgi:hypothetical protein
MKDHDRFVAGPSLANRRVARRGLRVTCFFLLSAAAPSLAHASSPRPIAAEGLLPKSGATNVPLNAVLIATTSLRFVDFTLKEADSGMTVPLSTACEHIGGDPLCFGRPGPLAPHTTYVWTATPDRSALTLKPGSTWPASPELRFTTGAVTDIDSPVAETPFDEDAWRVELLERKAASPNEPPQIRLRIGIPIRLREDAVLVASTNHRGALPIIGDDDNVLSPTTPAREAWFYATGDCMSFRVIDVAGNASTGPGWCPPNEATATDAAATDTAAPSPAACSINPGAPATRFPGGGAFGILIVLASSAALRRRRRT